jgi:hypothetical protein
MLQLAIFDKKNINPVHMFTMRQWHCCLVGASCSLAKGAPNLFACVATAQIHDPSSVIQACMHGKTGDAQSCNPGVAQDRTATFGSAQLFSGTRWPRKEARQSVDAIQFMKESHKVGGTHHAVADGVRTKADMHRDTSAHRFHDLFSDVHGDVSA